MNSSHLYNKAGLLDTAAHLTFDNCLYPAVAHSSYYRCFLLMSHIWIDKMHKTLDELDSLCANLGKGKHDVLIDQIYCSISTSNNSKSYKDSRDFNDKIKQLKRLRVSADYKNESFSRDYSAKALSLMDEIALILKKYL